MGAVKMRFQTADKNCSNCCFWAKYESSIQNIAFSSEKVILSESGEKYTQIEHYLQVYVNSPNQLNMLVDFYMRGQQWMNFFTDWKKHYYGL